MKQMNGQVSFHSTCFIMVFLKIIVLF